MSLTPDNLAGVLAVIGVRGCQGQFQLAMCEGVRDSFRCPSSASCQPTAPETVPDTPADCRLAGQSDNLPRRIAGLRDNLTISAADCRLAGRSGNGGVTLFLPARCRRHGQTNPPPATVLAADSGPGAATPAPRPCARARCAAGSPAG